MEAPPRNRGGAIVARLQAYRAEGAVGRLPSDARESGSGRNYSRADISPRSRTLRRSPAIPSITNKICPTAFSPQRGRSRGETRMRKLALALATAATLGVAAPASAQGL